MTINFKVRITKKSNGGDYVPLYVRVQDGDNCDQCIKTKILVKPEFWDKTLQGIKTRCLCPMEERKAVTDEIMNIRSFLTTVYMNNNLLGSVVPDGWLQKEINKYYKNAGKAPAEPKAPKLPKFDELFTQFLNTRDICEARRRHYEVIRRMIHRYESFVRQSQGRARYVLDVKKVDKALLDDLYEYLENECEFVQKYPRILEENPESREIKPRGENHMVGIFKRIRAFFNWLYETQQIDSFPFRGFEMPTERYGSPICLRLEDVEKIYNTDLSAYKSLAVQRDIFVFQCLVGCRVGDLLRLKKRDVINGAIEYIPSKTIKDHGETLEVPLNSISREIIERYADEPGERLLPFECSYRYNVDIKEVFALAGVTYLVTELDPLTRREKKTPINEIASSHLARRTFINTIYKEYNDPSMVSSMTGHVDGSRAFSRYRKIDRGMKKDMVNVMDWKKKD